MKIVKLFIFILMLVSCQARVAFRENNALSHYERLTDYYTNYQDNGADELIHQYIINQLRMSGGVLDEKNFNRRKDEYGFEEGTNIIYSFYPQLSRRIMFVTPYCPVGLSDEEIYREMTAIMAFGNAIMLELARLLSEQKPNQYGVDLVFLDCLIDREEPDKFVPAFELLNFDETNSKPEMGIYLFLHYSQELRIPIEAASYRHSPQLVHRVWEKGEEIGWKGFKNHIEESTLLNTEEVLYEKLNTIKLQNISQSFEQVEEERLKQNFRRLGYVFTEIIYDRD